MKVLPPIDLNRPAPVPTVITAAQGFALKWLRQHNGDGLFDFNGIAVAGGELAPIMRATWNALKAAGLVDFYNPTGKGRGRLRVTAAGYAWRDDDGR